MYLKNKRSYKVASTLFDLVNFMRGKKWKKKKNL
jgi:hypothetical protein